MKRYPEYKDSGVEWIGKIPRHWEIVRSKSLFGNRSDRSHLDEPLLSVTQDRGILPRDDLDYRVWNPNENIRSYKLVKPGDWVISLRSFEGGIELSEVRGIVSPAYTTMFSRRKIFSSYFKHLLKSVRFVDELNRITTGIRQGKNIAYANFSETRVTLPPLDEQIAIGTFLDRNTQKIDKLIRVKERKIELLGEYRASLIHEAVTKGLDPNVEMKPSGVEWMGEIPKHWKVIRNRFIFQQIRDVGHSCLMLLSIGIKGILPKSQTGQKDVSSDDKSLYKRVKIGDIAFNVMTAWKGGIGMSDYEGIVSPAYQVCRPCTNLVAKYFHYLFRTDLYKTIFDSSSHRVVDERHNLYFDDFKNISSIFPPLSEQNQIVDYLDRKTRQIDELRSNEERIVKLLKEYRQSLISEVVTGKIDVRGEV